MRPINIPRLVSTIDGGFVQRPALGKTRVIAVVFPTFCRGIFAELLQGIEAMVQKEHFFLLTVGSAPFCGSEDPFETALKIVEESRADGLIICRPSFSFDQTQELRAYGVPFVVLDHPRNGPRMDAVVYDSEKGAYAATRHLIDHGHRRIATLTGPLEWESAAQRLQGYKRALKEHGLSVDPNLIVEGNWGVEPSVDRFICHFRHRQWPQAVFAANDYMALGLLKHTSRHEDLLIRSTAIIGFDDIEPARAADLTTVRGSVEMLGRRLAGLLLELIRNPDPSWVEPRVETLPVDLVVRTSCGCRATARKSKEKFLRFPENTNTNPYIERIL